MIAEEDDSPDESEADPIDADLKNADWPKRLNDTQEGIEERLASLPKRTPFISGKGWFAWFDYELMDWDSDAEVAPLGMLREGFGKEQMVEYIDSNKTRTELYEDAVSFLAQWGVKATVVS